MWVPNLLGSIPNTVTSYVTLGKTYFQFPNFQSGIMISRELVRKWRGTKERLDKAEREWKSWLKLNFKKKRRWSWHLVPFSQFSSVAQSCLTLGDPMDCSTPGLPVHHPIPEFIQTHVHWAGDAIQPPHPLSSPSPPVFNHLQHQGLFKWLSSSHQVAKVLEFQLQYQSFQWIFRTDFL